VAKSLWKNSKRSMTFKAIISETIPEDVAYKLIEQGKARIVKEEE
jgi:hypothetical protein